MDTSFRKVRNYLVRYIGRFWKERGRMTHEEFDEFEELAVFALAHLQGSGLSKKQFSVICRPDMPYVDVVVAPNAALFHQDPGPHANYKERAAAMRKTGRTIEGLWGEFADRVNSQTDFSDWE